jgi:hypothetical protein
MTQSPEGREWYAKGWGGVCLRRRRCFTLSLRRRALVSRDLLLGDT